MPSHSQDLTYPSPKWESALARYIDVCVYYELAKAALPPECADDLQHPDRHAADQYGRAKYALFDELCAAMVNDELLATSLLMPVPEAIADHPQIKRTFIEKRAHAIAAQTLEGRVYQEVAVKLAEKTVAYQRRLADIDNRDNER